MLAAALFIFGGASSGRLQHTGIIIIYAVFPLAFLLLQLALQRRSLLLAAGFAIIAAAQPGGLAGLCVTAGGRGSRDISLGPAIVLFTGAIWRVGDELTSCRQG